MFKRIFFVISVIIALGIYGSGCASTQLQMQKDAVTDSTQQDTYLEENLPDLPSWVYEEGLDGEYMVATGSAEAGQDTSPITLRRAAMMDAESLLFSKAPHEYRELVQSAMSSAGVSGVNFTSIQSKLTKLHGVTGVKFPRNRFYCYKAIRDNGDYIKVSRVCYQQARVSVAALNRTIERTMNAYYSNKTIEKFKNAMKDELSKLTKGKQDDNNSQANKDVPSSANILARSNRSGTHDKVQSVGP